MGWEPAKDTGCFPGAGTGRVDVVMLLMALPLALLACALSCTAAGSTRCLECHPLAAKGQQALSGKPWSRGP